MPIRQYLEGHRFDAETVRLMGVAFAMAVVTLQQRRRIDPLRDSVAHKIIELAKAGERDPCPYRKPHPASEQTANRVMFVPDDRFSHVAGMCADQALPIEGTA
jgi:hypothetical protein